jgi:hypothetical protein
MQTLPESIDDVIIHLENIVRSSIIERKRIGYFAALYLRVTIEIRDKIKDNYFENAELVEKLDVVFANRFLDAYYKHLDNEPITESWRVAFKSATLWHPLVIQHLFLGMNAHIGLDLGIASATVCPGSSIDKIFNDFTKVNSILSSLVNEVQDGLASIWPLLKIVDRIAGKLDEAMAAFSMEIARDKAWKVAQDYAQIQNEDEKEKFIQKRDIKVADFSRKLYQPGFILSVIIFILRFGEIGTIKGKIRKLTTSDSPK